MKSSNAKVTLAAALLALSTTVPALSYAGDRDDEQRKRLIGAVIGASVGAVVASNVGSGNNKLAGAAIGAVGGYVVGDAVSNRDSRRQVNHYSHRDERRDWDRHGLRSQGSHGYRPEYGYRQDNHRYHPAPGARGYKPHRPHRAQYVPGVFHTKTATRLRRGPGRNYRGLAMLPGGAPVQIVRNSTQHNWVLVARGGRELGYVYAPLLYKARPSAGNWNMR